MSGSCRIKLTVPQLAAIIGKSERHTRRQVKRGRLGDQPIEVVLKHDRGGSGGLRYMVFLDSLERQDQTRAREFYPGLEEPTPPVPAPKPRKRSITKRSDWGGERLLFLRHLVERAGLGSVATTAIEVALDHETKQLWAGRAGRVGWRRVARWAGDFLYNLTIEHRAELPEAELRRLCRVPKSYVRRWERRKHRKTDTWLHDRQAFKAAEPGVRRNRPEWPLDILYGDGSAFDIRVLRPDGGEWKVWLILWMDAATNRLFGHCYARPKGGGVTQQHVGFSLICLASAVGMPRAVYIDNGSEYGKLKLLQTTGLARVIHALPYGARAKAIESIIGWFMRQHVSQIEGYIGSDRFAKPTETDGQPTAPFPGTMQALFGALAEAIDVFNSMPQETLGGRSPDAVWQDAVDRGWRPARIDPATLAEALVRIETRKVKQGFVTVAGVEFSCDALCRAADLEGKSVAVHIPSIAGMPPSVYAPDGRFVGLVHKREWQEYDRAGAREAGRLKTLRRQGARDLERAAAPADVQPYQAAWLERHAPPYDAPPGELIAFPGERGKAAEARRQASALPAAEPPKDDPRLARRRRMAGLPALPASNDRSS